ncbi:carboxypeptidase regulatory-like domain-containing protein, partial [Diaphorobacter sp. DS2]
MALLPLTRRCAMPVLSPFPFRLPRLAPLGLCALLASGASAVQA